MVNWYEKVKVDTIHNFTSVHPDIMESADKTLFRQHLEIQVIQNMAELIRKKLSVVQDTMSQQVFMILKHLLLCCR